MIELIIHSIVLIKQLNLLINLPTNQKIEKLFSQQFSQIKKHDNSEIFKNKDIFHFLCQNKTNFEFKQFVYSISSSIEF